jgi:hypothetical protein
LDGVCSVVELPPIESPQPPNGYRGVTLECFGCYRDFEVFVPEGKGLGLTVDLRCPYCRLYEVEVALAVNASSRPVLVQPLMRSPEVWHLRRLRELDRIMHLVVRLHFEGRRRYLERLTRKLEILKIQRALE